jgi:hypothetical protein
MYILCHVMDSEVGNGNAETRSVKRAWKRKSYLNRGYLIKKVLVRDKDGSYCSRTVFKIL